MDVNRGRRIAFMKRVVDTLNTQTGRLSWIADLTTCIDTDEGDWDVLKHLSSRRFPELRSITSGPTLRIERETFSVAKALEGEYDLDNTLEFVASHQSTVAYFLRDTVSNKVSVRFLWLMATGEWYPISPYRGFYRWLPVFDPRESILYVLDITSGEQIVVVGRKAYSSKEFNAIEYTRSPQIQRIPDLLDQYTLG